MAGRVISVPGSDTAFEDAGLDLDDLTIDSIEFDDSSFLNCDVTVRDVATRAGGQEMERKDGTGTFTTTDQIVLLCSVTDEAFPEGGVSYISLPLPKVGPDGRRRKPRAGSKYAIFLEMLSSLGVSATEGMDTCYRLSQMSDLIGLKFHRSQEQMTLGNFTTMVDKPTEILGFDHELREAQSTENRPLRAIAFTPPQTV